MMRRWLPYAAIAAFYAAIFITVQMWIYPILARPLTQRDIASRKYSELQQRVMFENNLLRDGVLRDSLQRTAPGRPGLFVADLDSATGYVTRVLQREVGSAPQAAIVVTRVDEKFGTHPGVTDIFSSRTIVTGKRAGVPSCTIVLPEHLTRRSGFIAQQTAWGGFTGSCYFFARYGSPGSHISEWITVGGARHFARYNDPVQNSWRGFISRADLPPNYEAQLRRHLPLRGQKCLAGQKRVCAQSVASFEMTDEERKLYYRMGSNTRVFFGEGGMLAVLEAQFGADRFRRFWTSNQPFQQAFESAFDVPLGEWVYEWVAPLGHMRAGARLDHTSVLLTFLLICALVGGAILTAQNRRI